MPGCGRDRPIVAMSIASKGNSHSGALSFEGQRQGPIGVSCEGLTRHKNDLLTKPHVFTSSRLSLTKTLVELYHKTAGDENDKFCGVVNSFHDLWVSRIVGELCFLKDKETNEIGMAVRAGPYNVLTIDVVAQGSSWILLQKWREVCVKDLDRWEIAEAKPIVLVDGTGSLGWKAGDWMSLPMRVALHGILEMPCSLLTLLCSKLGLKAGRLTRKLRVELFLKHMGMEADYINSILEQLPDKPVKKKNKAEDDEEANPDAKDLEFESVTNQPRLRLESTSIHPHNITVFQRCFGSRSRLRLHTVFNNVI